MKKIAVLGSKNTFREFLRLVADPQIYEHILIEDKFEGREYSGILKLWDWRSTYRDPDELAFFIEHRIR